MYQQPLDFDKRHILIVDKSVLRTTTNYLGTLKVLDEMQSKCNITDTEVQQLTFPKSTRYEEKEVIVYTGIDGGKESDILMFDYNFIIGKASVIVYEFGNMKELYGICVDPVARGTGVGSSIMKYILEQLDGENSKLWLGVNFSNQMWHAATGMYTKYGFGRPQTVIKSPNNVGFSTPVLGLVRQPGQGAFEPERLKSLRLLIEYHKINYMRSSFKKITLEIPPKDMSRIYNTVTHTENEIGMLLVPRKVVGSTFLIEDIVYEREGDTGSVNIPHGKTDLATAHTHPLGTYTSTNVNVAWPSLPDYNAIMGHYASGRPAHCVFTMEGAYVVSLNFVSQYILLSLMQTKLVPDFVARAHMITMMRFQSVIQLPDKSVLSDPFEIRQEIDRVLSSINSYHVEDLLRDMINPQTNRGISHPYQNTMEENVREHPLYVNYLGFLSEENTRSLMTMNDQVKQGLLDYLHIIENMNFPKELLSDKAAVDKILGRDTFMEVDSDSTKSKPHQLFEIKLVTWKEMEQAGGWLKIKTAILDIPEFRKKGADQNIYIPRG